MWYKSSSIAYPPLIDITSSKIYVYVRKNVEEQIIEEEGENKNIYIYDELKIPKEVYGIFEKELVNDTRLNDIEEVLTEIIGGGN